MPSEQSKTEYKRHFIERVKAARVARGYTQHDIAELLDIDQGNYKQYETRSFLPHDLVPRFCLACGVDCMWLFSAKGKGPQMLPQPREIKKKPPSRKTAKAA
ncbi:MAG: hypothetical protein JWR80_4982 [Bradyrhizobium sp.]|nr:hypothetical protein [Bradyrhizobium sp.]